MKNIIVETVEGFILLDPKEYNICIDPSFGDEELDYYYQNDGGGFIPPFKEGDAELMAKETIKIAEKISQNK